MCFSTFEKRVLYDTLDCTNFINYGKNAIGIGIGNGWYSQSSIKSGPKSIRVLISIQGITSTDKLIIISDKNWKQTNGPILMDDIYQGETFDARMETIGWDMPDYDDTDWKNGIFCAFF